MKKILFISQTAYGSSPTNRYLKLCSNIPSKDYAITMFFIGKGKEKEDRDIKYPQKHGNIRIVHSPAIPNIIIKRHGFAGAALTGIYLILTCLPVLFIHFLKNDIVHLGKPLPFGSFLVNLLRLILRKPLVLDMDDWEGVGGFASVKQGKNAFSKAVITYYEEKMPFVSSKVVVVSKLLRKRLLVSGISEENIHYIPNGADIAPPEFNTAKNKNFIREKFPTVSDNDYIIGYLGTFKPGGANWELIIDIFRESYKRKKNLKLMLIGFGPDLERVKLKSEEYGFAEALLFTGKVDHEEVPNYLGAADCFILPYSIDFPDTFINIGRSSLKLYEYMAMGKTIIASDIGEIHESLKEGAGILVSQNDPLLFAEAILTASDGNDHSFGEESLSRVINTYNYKSLAGKLKKVYDQIR